MKDLTLHIPEGIDLDEQEATLMLAASLYSSAKLSLGQAADLAGLSKRSFAEVLGSFNISLFNYSAEELAQDVRNG